MSEILSEVLAPPDGWTLSGSLVSLTNLPILNNNSLSLAYDRLRLWANRNNKRLAPYQADLKVFNSWADVYVYSHFSLIDDENATSKNNRLLATYVCNGCKSAPSPRTTRLAAGTVLCASCEMFQACSGCRKIGLSLMIDDAGRRSYCGNCTHECNKDGCSNQVLPAAPGDRCTTCDPRHNCLACGSTRPENQCVLVTADKMGPKNSNKDAWFCSECASRFICHECGRYSYSGLQKKPGTDTSVCQVCLDRELIKKEKGHQAWPAHDMPVSGNLLIPSSPERPVRTVSIETEFDGDGRYVARALYRYGLIDGPEIGRYSTQGQSDGRAPSILKSDGSVSGGELVTYMLDLDQENHAAALLRVTEVMRSMRELGLAKFSRNAGGHVHQDLHGYTLNDCWNLYTVFRFLEDPLYRLAGAGELGKHRSLDGNSYGNAPTAGPFGRLQEFVKSEIDGAARRGIHFENFAIAQRACRCGSVRIGKHDECECNLGKATVEWRLWNAEITPRILHAWLALMQSITAFAQDNELKESDYPYLPFRPRRFTALDVSHVEETKRRLEWMHKHLPLTIHERDSIIETAKRSELNALGSKYLNGLLDIASDNDQTKQKKRPPKNPSNSREQTFELRTADEMLELPTDLGDGGALIDTYIDDDYDPDYDLDR